MVLRGPGLKSLSQVSRICSSTDTNFLRSESSVPKPSSPFLSRTESSPSQMLPSDCPATDCVSPGLVKANEKILLYHDVVLRRADLDILRGPHYINDRIIEFYFSFLSSAYPTEDILFVPPAICFFILNCPDFESLKDIVEPLKLPEKKIVIFTVNDNDDVTIAEGGQHWSLLAYERGMNVFVHHDSISGLNGYHGRKLAKAVEGFLKMPGSVSAGFVDGSTPQQMNAYDCGVYVMAIARVICRWEGCSKNEDDLWFSAVKEEINTSVVADMRKEILELIHSMMAQKSGGSNNVS